ncbi:MAG: right-handed parallel beta-helix repeat-containing protein [Bryobacterales bacterium]|nr:right-handed parallel beta-helix repeat-containing protein [Bryobacterales bacterium]
MHYSPLIHMKIAQFYSWVSLFIAVPVILPAQTGSTYFVAPAGSDSAGDGSSARPWATLTKAAASVPDNGSTVVVRNGTYEGLVRISRKFTNPTVFRAENPYRAKFRNRSQLVLMISGAVNIELSGFDFRRSGSTSSPLAIHIAASENIVLYNNLIHESYNNDLLKINESSRNILIIGNRFRNQQGSAGQHIDVNGCTNVLIRENIFYNDQATAAGVRMTDTHGFIVIKNSGGVPESRRTHVTGNVFLNYIGNTGSNFVLIGEDGKPYHEAQEVVVENNLMIGNSPVKMRAPFGVKGGRDIVFRNNTVAGDLPANAFGMRLNREVRNPVNRGIRFLNNIWSDPTGTMNDFSDGLPSESTDLELRNNLYWNGGTAIPVDNDVLNYVMDPRTILANPLLPSQSAAVVLPSWRGDRFSSGTKSIREEFERLVKTYGKPAAGSPVIGRSEAADTPEHDILDAARGAAPDLGAVEVGAATPKIRLVLAQNRVMGGVSLAWNRVILAERVSGANQVLLQSSAPAVAAIPAAVPLKAGDDSVRFEIVTKSVSVPTPVTISASYGSSRHTVTLLVVPQGVVSVNARKETLNAGDSEHLLMMEGPASAPLTIQLSSSKPDLVTFPQPVVVAAGQSYARFQMRCQAAVATTAITVTASYGASSASTVLNSNAALGVTELTFNTTKLLSGKSLIATAKISEPAPAGGAVLQVATTAAAVFIPETITVPAGATAVTFSVVGKTVAQATSVGLTVTAATGIGKTSWFSVEPDVAPANADSGNSDPATFPYSLYIKPWAPGGGVVPVALFLNRSGHQGIRVSLAYSNSTLAQGPSYIDIPAGQSRGEFPMRIQAVAHETPLTVTATANGVSKSRQVAITQPSILRIYPKTSTITGGTSLAGNTVLLSGAAASGTSVKLASSNTAALQVPTSIALAAGANRFSFTATTRKVSKAVLVTVTVTSGRSSETVTFQVAP